MLQSSSELNFFLSSSSDMFVLFLSVGQMCLSTYRPPQIFRDKSRKVSETIGAPARGVAEYPTGDTPRPNPYETPEDICGGEYVLKHFWPTDRKKTNVSLELDKKKFMCRLLRRARRSYSL